MRFEEAELIRESSTKFIAGQEYKDTFFSGVEF